MNEGVQVGREIASGQYSQSWILAIVLILIIIGMGYLIFRAVQIFFNDFSKKLFDRMDKFEETVEKLVKEKEIKDVKDQFASEALTEFKKSTNERLLILEQSLNKK